jgi:uncharacterized membrane protein YkvA (DUF1232 family)
MLELQIHLNQNLPSKLFSAMKRCIKKCGSLPEHYLFSACEKHLRDALEESQSNSLVDIDAVQKLTEAFLEIKDGFVNLPENVQIALKAAMYYFALDEDDEPDFSSVNGFDDDVKVSNVCLTFAGREDLKIDLGRELK